MAIIDDIVSRMLSREDIPNKEAIDMVENGAMVYEDWTMSLLEQSSEVETSPLEESSLVEEPQMEEHNEIDIEALLKEYIDIVVDKPIYEDLLSNILEKYSEADHVESIQCVVAIENSLLEDCMSIIYLDDLKTNRFEEESGTNLDGLCNDYFQDDLYEVVVPYKYYKIHMFEVEFSRIDQGNAIISRRTRCIIRIDLISTCMAGVFKACQQ